MYQYMDKLVLYTWAACPPESPVFFEPIGLLLSTGKKSIRIPKTQWGSGMNFLMRYRGTLPIVTRLMPK